MVAGTDTTTRYVNYGSNFTQVLMNTTAENSSTHLFHLNNASQGEAENLFKSRSIDALIIIPQNFSAGLASEVNISPAPRVTYRRFVGSDIEALAARCHVRPASSRLSSPTIEAKDDTPLVFEA